MGHIQNQLHLSVQTHDQQINLGFARPASPINSISTLSPKLFPKLKVPVVFFTNITPSNEFLI